MAGALRSLEELLTNQIGLDTTSVGSQLITRAVKQRMRDLKLDDLDAILDPRLLEGSSVHDVVLCRNLLIYLIPSARAGLLAVIDRVLAPDGVLLVGHADRFGSAGAGTGFTPVGDPGCFAYRRIACGEPPLPPVWQLPESPQPVLSLLPPAAIRAIEASIPLEAAVSSAGPVAPALVNTSIPIAAETSLLLDQAADLANKGHFSEAIAACERHIRQKGLTAPAYYLMGMICQAAGDRRRAEDCFQKTVYLDPSHDEALLALALLAERRGDQCAAAGFRRRAERTAIVSSKRVN